MNPPYNSALWIHFVVILLYVETYAISIAFYRRNTTLDDIEILQSAQAISLDNTLIACASKCLDHHGGEAFAYNFLLRQCFIFEGKTSDHSYSSMKVEVSGWRHYDFYSLSETGSSIPTASQETQTAPSSQSQFPVHITTVENAQATSLNGVTTEDLLLQGKTLIDCLYASMCDVCDQIGIAEISGLTVCCPGCGSFGVSSYTVNGKITIQCNC